MSLSLPWFIAALCVAAAAGLGLGLLLKQHSRRQPPLPKLWSLTPRPVFSSEERTLFRQLREALPDHVVLSKLPLVRFCQPADPQQVRYWYDLLGHGHVSFALCSVNGRVLAAIDLDGDRTSRRGQQVKEAVLNACRVRYLRCAPDQVPSLPELQALVPVVVSAQPRRAKRKSSTAAPAAEADAAAGFRDDHTSGPATPPRDPLAMWQQAGTPQDAIYGFDEDGRPADGGGIVVDGPARRTGAE